MKHILLCMVAILGGCATKPDVFPLTDSRNGLIEWVQFDDSQGRLSTRLTGLVVVTSRGSQFTCTDAWDVYLNRELNEEHWWRRKDLTGIVFTDGAGDRVWSNSGAIVQGFGYAAGQAMLRPDRTKVSAGAGATVGDIKNSADGGNGGAGGQGGAGGSVGGIGVGVTNNIDDKHRGHHSDP